jgi:hypothetical protein
MSAADYINEYLARNAPSFMAAPWRHPSGVVRALWHKQNMWLAKEEMEGAEKPSDEFDRAFDAHVKHEKKYETAVRDAWASRELERLSEGYDIPGIIASERVVA